MPDMKQVGECIEVLTMPHSVRWGWEAKDKAFKTALSILQHVQKHGMALEEGEIEEIMANTPTPTSDGDIHPGEFNIIAKEIADKQRKMLSE